MTQKRQHRVTRRSFLSASGTALAALPVAVGFPAIVPATVFGRTAPSNRIQVGAIGVGRISRGHDIPGIAKHDLARVVAVCDLDTRRLAEGKKFVEDYYAAKPGTPTGNVAAYAHYRDLLANADVDAVVISTPDHWHALIAIAAVEHGKDVYLQKPASLTIAEGRALSNAAHRCGRLVQIGSQQRSSPQFRYAAELVRNGRIGQLQTVEVGLPGDPSGEDEPEMPVPKHLDYDMWLGSTPYVYYTEKRVHPQTGYGRPGWLRCEQFGAGMITGWGAHHVDSAHWGMDTEYSGPIEIWGSAQFPAKGLWDVHGDFKTYGRYANGVTMVISGEFPNGIKFIGSGGWIFVSRGNETVTASDPVSRLKDSQALAASDPKIIESVIEPQEVHLEQSLDHHGNWLEALRTRRQPIAPIEVGHRSCSACLLHHIAMRANRTLRWDPLRERFKDDDEANALVARPQRPPYIIS